MVLLSRGLWLRLFGADEAAGIAMSQLPGSRLDERGRICPSHREMKRRAG